MCFMISRAVLMQTIPPETPRFWNSGRVYSFVPVINRLEGQPGERRHCSGKDIKKKNKASPSKSLVMAVMRLWRQMKGSDIVTLVRVHWRRKVRTP